MTAVEWLAEIIKHCKKYQIDIEQIDIEQALEMEKQQIMGAWHNGKINEQDFFSDHTETIVRANCAEQYYNKIYKK